MSRAFGPCPCPCVITHCHYEDLWDRAAVGRVRFVRWADASQ
jgi:hypothetical protein